MIKIEQVSFGYEKDIAIFSDLSLEIEANATYGILGHNGAGKTTLFRLILGLLKPEAGLVEVAGQNPRDAAELVAYLPESNGIYSRLTAMENMQFRARMGGVKKAKQVERCQQLLTEVGLAKQANRQVRGFSQGMKKRLGLACALVGHPKVLLLDEPTNGIDPESLDQVLGLLEKRKGDTTMLLISHELEVVSQIADYAVIMEEGELVYQGAIEPYRDSVRAFYLEQLRSFREG